MKLTDIDLYDPGEVIEAIKLLMWQYKKVWGADDDFLKLFPSSDVT